MLHDLEAKIHEQPDNPTHYAVYADWLMERGDPRGEFISIQLQLEDDKLPADQRQQLQKQEKKLLQAHEKTWLGSLAEPIKSASEPEYFSITYRFERGYLHTLIIPYLSVSLARAIARAPETGLLRRLEIHMITYDDSYEPGDDIPADANDEGAPFYALGAAQHLGRLRILHLGEPCDLDDPYFNCHLAGDGALEFVEQLPQLEELYLLSHRPDTPKLFALPLPHLRVLHLFHGSHYPLEQLAANSSLGNLTDLAIHPHALDYGDDPYINLEGLRAIVNSPHLKSLTRLYLRGSDMGDTAADVIVESGILKRLQTLDLRSGSMTDEGASRLAACPDIVNLERLNLFNNALSQAGIDALRATGVNLTADHQHSADDEQRDWLFDGDIE